MATVTMLHRTALYLVTVDDAELGRLIKACHEYVTTVPPYEDAAKMVELRDKLLKAQDRRDPVAT